MRTILLVLIAFGLGIGAAHVPWLDLLRGGPKPLTDAEWRDPVGSWAAPLLIGDAEGLPTYRGYFAWRFERDGALFVREVRDDAPSAPRVVAGRWRWVEQDLRVRLGDAPDETQLTIIGRLPAGLDLPAGTPLMVATEPTILVPIVRFEGSTGRATSSFVQVTRCDGDPAARAGRWTADVARLREQQRARR
ncbi:MAG: hypothetical protein U1E39_01310 [Planctomycetota bacterium]